MICHHLRTRQVFVPERINTRREEGCIFRNSWMVNLFQVNGEFMLAPHRTNGQYIYTKPENAIISSNQFTPLNSGTLKLGVINSLPVLKALPWEPLPIPPLVVLHSICIACYTFQNFPTWILSSGAQVRWTGRGGVSPILQRRKLRLES